MRHIPPVKIPYNPHHPKTHCSNSVIHDVVIIAHGSSDAEVGPMVHVKQFVVQ